MFARLKRVRRRLLGCAVALAVACGPAAGRAEQAPLRQAVRVLRDGPLVVEVMEPNDAERYNRAERFSPVANVLRVTLAGVDFLYAPAGHDPFVDNGGLAMEFDNAKFGPPGFVEAAVGEGFLKIGVGVLRKAADLYHFMRRQEIVAPAATSVEWREDRALFRQVCPAVNGYAYALSARVEVRANRVEITYRLENTGAKPFATRQYAHNYFTLGQPSVGAGFEVEFPFDFDAVGLDEGRRQQGRTIFYDAPVAGFSNITVPILYHYLGENRLVARHRPSGRAIVVTTSLTGPHAFIHATPDYISPEQFVVLRLAAGEAAEWSRRYEFILDERASSLAAPR